MAAVTCNAQLRVNGQDHALQIEPGTLLVDCIRGPLGLTGTHQACDTAQCGACTVQMNGRAVKACSMLALQAQGADITTIEGLAQGDALHPMQAAFREAHGLQCGFCTPGMVIAGIAIAARHGPNVDEETIRHDLEGNLCRCTGYTKIVKAIRAGAAAL